MALINCKECNKEISSKARSCPHCGAPIEIQLDANTEIPDKKAGLIILGVILLVIGLFLLFDGTDKMLNGNNNIKYDEKSYTYTVTIWEDENFTK